jgi:hypothetical protein
MRPIILNGIAEVGTRPDLIERSLFVELPFIPDEQRRAEAELLAEFDEAHPVILGGLLDAVVVALRELPRTTLPALPRMADFALWVTAAERGLGWEPGSFLGAYNRNRRKALDVALEASPIVDPLRELVEGEDGERWEGSASELLDKLTGNSRASRSSISESHRASLFWGVGAGEFDNDDLNRIRDAVLQNRSIVAATRGTAGSDWGGGVTTPLLVSSHCYSVMGLAYWQGEYHLLLRNPWGFDNNNGHTYGDPGDGFVVVSWGDFRHSMHHYWIN